MKTTIAPNKFLRCLSLVLLATLFASCNAAFCDSTQPVENYYQETIVDVSSAPILINTVACLLNTVPGTDNTSLEAAIPFPWAFWGVLRPVVYINTAGFVTFDRSAQSSLGCLLNNPGAPTGCNRPLYDFPSYDRSNMGFEGIAPLWATLYNVTVSCVVGDDSANAGKRWMKISWNAEESEQTFTNDPLGPANFSLYLSNSGFNNIGTEYAIYHHTRSFASEWFVRGSWYYLELLNGQFCYQNVTFPYLETDYAWKYSAVCGDGAVSGREECDQGPNSTSCIHCVCSPGFSCSGSTVSSLPPMTSMSSLTIVGFERGQFQEPAINFRQWGTTLPSLNRAETKYLFGFIFPMSFCAAFGQGTDSFNDCIGVYGPDYVSSAALRPSTYPTLEGSTTIRWSNGTTFVTPFSSPRPFSYPEPLALGLLPDNGLLVNTNLSASVGSTAYGCKYPGVLYLLSYDSASSDIVVRAMNDSTGSQLTAFAVYRTPWTPDGLQQPAATVAVNGSSQNIYLFVYSWNASQSEVHILSPELGLVSRAPWSMSLRDGIGSQIPVAATYFHDFDAFGFSLVGKTGIFEIDSAVFHLGYPSRYSTGVHRVVSRPRQPSFSTEYGVIPYTVVNNVCCKTECYNGFCNSTSGQCVCNSGFTGPSCTNFAKTFTPMPTPANSTTPAVYVVLRRFWDTELLDRADVAGCVNPSTGTSALSLMLNSSIVDNLAVPFNTSRTKQLDILPGIAVSSPVVVRVDNLYCRADPTTFTLLPGAAVSGDARYAPFYTLVPVVEPKPNVTLQRTFEGVEGDISGFSESEFPNDPVLYRVRPVSSSAGGQHSVFIASDGLCIGSYSFQAPSDTIPALTFSPRFVTRDASKKREAQALFGAPCVDLGRFQLRNPLLSFGIECPSNVTYDPKDNATLVNDFWVLVGCDPGVNLTITYTFIPPSMTDTNCSLAAALSGVSCNSSSQGSTIRLTNSTTFVGDLYVPKGTTFDLNNFTFNVVGDLYFDGNITTTWTLTTNSTGSKKRTTIPGGSTIPSASIGSTGTVVVSNGCANLGDTTLNVLIDASTLPAGTSSSSNSQTNVTVNPIIFDCGNATNVKQNTQIVNDNDRCVDHSLKSSQVAQQKNSLQVLFSFETTPTGGCNGNITSPETGIPGNDLDAGKIAAIAVAVVGGLLVIGVVIYIASPACRSKVTPYRGTTV